MKKIICLFGRILTVMIFVLLVVGCACYQTDVGETQIIDENNPVVEEISETVEQNVPFVSEEELETRENLLEEIATESWEEESDAEEVSVENSELQVHYIDIGQGDSTLIICDEEAMLIDAGNNDKGTAVQLYLTKQGVSKLKYVVGTHPDADHIGGLDVILYKYDCETVIMPDIWSDTATYRDVIDTMKLKKYPITFPTAGDEYRLGSAVITILGPRKAYSNHNNCSVVLRIEHGENSFLFTGDMEGEAEENLLLSQTKLLSTVLKVGHHGGNSSTGEAFLNEVNPQYAVISCGQDNAYGHPHAEVLNRLRAAGCQVYRTDEQGSIVVTSDGSQLFWNCAPSDSWKSGEQTGNSLVIPIESSVEIPAQVETDEIIAPEITYVLNTNSMKFHTPHCDSVKDIKAKNRQDSTEDRDTIISRGYTPCKRCNP